MKTLQLSNDNYFDIENIIKKIANENDIKNVSSINIHMSKNDAYLKIKFADENGESESESKYTIYYRDVIRMNGEGIEYITDRYDEEYSPDIGLQGIVEDLGETIPEYYDYEISLYVNADMAGYDLSIDYKPDEVPDEVVDKINDWLWKNISFEKIGEDSENEMG